MGFDALKLEKGMYHEGGKSFTQVLESSLALLLKSGVE